MRTRLESLVRAVRWHRRGLGAVAAAIAVLAALTALTPKPPVGTAVVVVTGPIAAGSVIGAEQVAVISVPADLAPVSSFTATHQVIGRIAVVDLTRGTPLTSGVVLGNRPGNSKNQVLVPVRLADPAVLSLIKVGDLVTIVGHDETGRSVVLASRVRVALLTAPESPQGPLSTGGSSAGLLLVETDPESGAALTGATSRGEIAVMLG